MTRKLYFGIAWCARQGVSRNEIWPLVFATRAEALEYVVREAEKRFPMEEGWGRIKADAFEIDEATIKAVTGGYGYK